MPVSEWIQFGRFALPLLLQLLTMTTVMTVEKQVIHQSRDYIESAMTGIMGAQPVGLSTF